MDAHDTHSSHPQQQPRAGQSLRIDAGPSSALAPISPLDSPETPASALRRSSTTALPLPPDDFSPATTSPTSGPQRTTSRPNTATSTRSAGSKEDLGTIKRKRSRVTPEQLTQLERLFAQDRSPTAAKRKEISEMLGMQERQTQIWFQNRRAKAKNQGKPSRDSQDGSPPDSHPDHHHMSAQFDHARMALVHEEHPVTFIPCDDLTIGNWRRIASVTQRNDLLGYSCDAKRCLAWFIQSAGYGFKMEIPYEMVTRVNVATMPSRPDMALVTFFLSGTPVFFLENVVPSPAAPGVMIKSWCHCQDWTEGAQASNVPKHEVVGPYAAMVAALRMLPIGSRISGLDTAPPPPHRHDGSVPMQLPPPPLASLQQQQQQQQHQQAQPLMSISFPFTQEQAEAAAPLPHMMGRRRSLSGPSSTQGIHQHPGFAASTGQIHHYPLEQPQPLPLRPSTMQYGVATYPNHSAESLFRFVPPALAQPSPPNTDYSAPPSAYTSQMPGSAGGGGMMHSPMYTGEHVQDISRYSTSAGGASTFASASPPLLTQAFNPHPHMPAVVTTGPTGMPMHGIDMDPSLVHAAAAPFYDEATLSAGGVHSPLGTAFSSENRTISQRSSGSSLDGALGLTMPQGGQSTSPSHP